MVRSRPPLCEPHPFPQNRPRHLAMVSVAASIRLSLIIGDQQRMRQLPTCPSVVIRQAVVARQRDRRLVVVEVTEKHGSRDKLLLQHQLWKLSNERYLRNGMTVCICFIYVSVNVRTYTAAVLLLNHTPLICCCAALL